MTEILFLRALLYISCFGLVWFGATLVVPSVSSLARSWRLPRFVVSFFLLGILTSLPEITVGTIAVLQNDPVIFAGNLLGSVILMFLGVIPLLGIIGNGVSMPIQMDRKQLVFTLLVAMAPAFLVADQRIGQWEALFLIAFYLSLFVFFSLRESLWAKVKKGLKRKKKNITFLIAKILVGMVVLIWAGDQIVDSTLYFADIFRISPFFISLVVVSIGTNIPEIAIIFRAIVNRQKDVALADFLGSASANTLLFGVFTLLHGQTIYLPNHFLQRFVLLSVGLILFYFFARSRNRLSRREGFVLLTLYIAFVVFEFFLLAGTS